MQLKKRAASLVAAGALVGGSLVGLSAPEASAADVCDYSYIIRNNSTGYGYFQGATTLYVLPYAACGKQGTFVSGTKFAYWCYVINDYGNKWIFGRITGTDTKGWVHDPYVSWTEGTLNYC
ncbi:hypothetical protein AB0D78_40240 [Streptomyces avermitilis]|uniref:hypothetical protein n=1 Tax=Streptomyces avermitilis TaxID=33903 RepID=UPI0033A73584